MIVVAIIGILAAVAIPQYQNYVARAQVSEALVLASGAKTAVAEVAMVTGDFPANNKDAGLDSTPTNIKGTYVKQVEVGADGVINVTLADDAHEKIKGKILTLTPGNLTGGSITWACTGEEAIKAYLPSGCEAELASPDISSASAQNNGLALRADGSVEVEGSTPKKWVAGEMDPEATACWDEQLAYPVGSGDGNGWREGPSSNTFYNQEEINSYADRWCGWPERSHTYRSRDPLNRKCKNEPNDMHKVIRHSACTD